LVSGPERAPGWYGDPWGTEDERYYDGTAWTRAVRRPGSNTAAPGSGSALEVPPEVSPEVDPSDAPPADPSGQPGPAPVAPVAPVPPGWHPDPWGTGALRWWDGQRWTGHVSGPQGVTPALAVGAERSAARWARLSMLWAGPALGVYVIALSFQAHWVVDHWDEITRAIRANETVTVEGNRLAGTIGQVCFFALVVAWILFLLWFHRAAVSAAAAGLPARRRAGLATASFVIPIVNLWWPYQSACDLLPEGHPGRAVLRRWWSFTVGAFVGVVASWFVAFAGDWALAVVAGATVVCALLAASQARLAISEVVDAHEAIAR